MSRHHVVKTPGTKLNKEVLKRMINFIFSKNKPGCLFVAIAIVLTSAISVISSLFLKTLIDSYINPLINSTNPNFNPLAKVLFILSIIYLTAVILTFIYNKILVYIAQNVIKDFRDKLFSHMETLAISYFDTHAHGDIMSIYTNDVDTLRQVISQSFPQMLASALSVIAVFISMCFLSIPLTFLIVIMIIVMQFVMKKIASNSGHYFVKQQANLGKENAYIEEMMEGTKVIKVFTHEDIAIDEFERINNELFDSSFKANKFSNILMPIMGNLGNISYVLTAILGGLLSIFTPSLTVGTLASFLTLNRSFTQPITQISQQINAIIMAMAAAERIYKLLDETSEIDEGDVTLVNINKNNGILTECNNCTNHWAWKLNDGSLVELKGDVKFKDVHFAYQEGKDVLHDINLYAKPGQKIAFVGATGAGKTTITNLINRFYDIHKGSITYDDIDIKSIKKSDLRKSLGIVLQDTHLFSGTIKENIKYSKPDASDEEVIAAAKLANAHSFIKHLENGYDTMLTADGSSLSQGQRQLLSIARASLANPPVLILDEATSSIDSRTERIVQDGMDKLMKGRTSFVIAHRLSTIKNSDVIMVMDHGKIIERGNHNDLLNKKGIYYELYTGALEID